MKNSVIFFLALALVGCNKQEGYTIKIEMQDLAGASLVLQQPVNRELVTIDSVVLDASGSGEMSGYITAPEMMYLGQKGTRQNLPVFMDNFNYTITGTFDDLAIDADGGPQVDYNTYKEGISKFEEEQKKILDVYYQAMEDSVSRDSIEVILEPYYAINEKKMAYDSVYMADHPSSAMTLYLLRNSFYSMEPDELGTMLDNFDATLHPTSYYKMLAEHVEKMKNVQIGEQFVEIELPDTEGNTLRLSELVGEGPLLIDFWASWCGPCRRANPGVVEIYNEFHSKGFDILGVSLDRTKEDWLKGIEEDNLTWHHVSDLAFWESKGADLYAVKSIPHTVLLDKDGIIVARNLSKEELKEKLKEMLGS